MKISALLSVVAATITLGAAAPALAQTGEFTLRAGSSVRYLATNQPGLGGDRVTTNISDAGHIAIDIAPGYRFAKIIGAELTLSPLIPIGATNFDFLVAPGVFLDLQLAYARASLPIRFEGKVNAGVDVAAGISFIGHGYLGALFNYNFAYEAIGIGAEVGWRF